jgi:hypothetical protein
MAGVTLAAVAVVIGAPLFGAGLRALRLRRALARLTRQRLDEARDGFFGVEGRVALDSPLFSPLSGQRCAGFQLEVHGVDFPMARTVEEVRPFRLVDRGTVALVNATRARWSMPQTDERLLEPDDPLTERLLYLMGEIPEAAWLRQSGRRLRLVERALLSGATCHVIGQVARGAATVWREELEWGRTGTDDAPIELGNLVVAAGEAPALSISPADQTDFMVVSVGEPDPARLAIPARSMVGVVAGPVLGMLGLLYLAAAADFWRTLRAF